MILGRAYLREIGLHLLMVLGGVTLLVSLGAAVRASSTSQGAPIWFPLALMPLLVGNLLPYLVSVTLLVAVILTYGRMAADREEVALRAAGMHPLRLMLPALLAGAVVAALIYPFSAEVLPRIYTAMRNLSHSLRYAALQNVNPPASELHVQGLHLLWRNRGPDGSFEDVTLFYRPDVGFAAFVGDPAAGKLDLAASRPVHLRANAARMLVEGTTLVLRFDGARTFSDTEEEDAWAVPTLEALELRLDLRQLNRRREIEKKSDDYSSARLLQILAARSLTTDGMTRDLTEKELSRFRFAFWRRVSVAFSAVPLALLGAMLGWRLRRGGFLAAFATAFGALFVFYYPFYYLGSALQQSGAMDAAVAAWLPVFVLLPVLAALSRVPRLL